MLKIFRFRYDNILFEQARLIREEVFIREQEVDPELEYEHEEEAIHFIAFYEDEPIATARYRETGHGIKLERFATLKEYRNQQVGAAMLYRILEEIKPLEKEIYLNAQMMAVPFYKKHGFVEQGETFMEADIEHVKMVYQK